MLLRSATQSYTVSPFPFHASVGPPSFTLYIVRTQMRLPTKWGIPLKRFRCKMSYPSPFAKWPLGRQRAYDPIKPFIYEHIGAQKPASPGLDCKCPFLHAVTNWFLYVCLKNDTNKTHILYKHEQVCDKVIYGVITCSPTACEKFRYL